ncbi:hypothetical protein CMK10_15370 [Candidatus Poribacteria bacterium]|jgi:hypothetical protein|nr:hypothetical protein [Candidatus Poribacteria bacterium]
MMKINLKKQSNSVTIRSLLVGLFCVILLCLVTPYNDYYLRGTFVSGNHFPIGAFFLFCILSLLTIALRWFRSHWQLSPAELITIWCMMLVAAGIPSAGFIRYHLWMLVSPYYFATPENDWKSLFFHHLPESIMVTEPKAVKYFYEGLPAGEPVPWLVWLKPALAWSAYALLTFISLTSLSVILRKQWVEHERFSFPLVKLPTEMVAIPSTSQRLNAFFRNPVMWFGAALPILIHLLNGLQRHYPNLPFIPLHFTLNPLLIDKPWSAMRSLSILIYPSIIGFTYLLSLDVSFSFWFFYLLYKLQSVVVLASGAPFSGWTLANRQEMGGYISLIIFVFWLARRHVWGVICKAFSHQPQIDDSNEPLTYRVALVALILSTYLIALLSSIIGLSFWLAVGVMLCFYMMAIVLTWMVTDGGFLFLLAIFRPSDYLMIAFGSARFRDQDHTILTFEKTMMFDLREFIMPHVMNSFKASDAVQLRRPQLMLAMFLAMVVGLGVAYYSGLMTWYHKGGHNMGYWFDPEPWNRLTTYLNFPRQTAWLELSFIGLGMLVMGLLIFMRYRFLWWRVHPLGYAMTTSWAPFTVWSSFFIGWICKTVILKIGGFKLFRQCQPFFLGMVFGEALIGGMWIIASLFTKVGYRLMPG